MTSILLSDFENSMRMQGKSANTVRNYSNTIRRFLQSGFIDPAAWVHYEKDQGASPAKLKGIRAACVAWLHFRKGYGQLEALLEYKLPAARPPARRSIPGGIDAVHAMIEACASDTEKLVISLGGLAGLRISETRSMNDESWNSNNGCLSIYGKGNRTRNVPVSAALEEILGDCVWVGKKLPTWIQSSDRTARMWVGAIGARAGISHADGSPIASHDLRATFATEVYAQSGNDIVTVQRLLGHRDVNTTQSYIGLLDHKVRAAVNF